MPSEATLVSRRVAYLNRVALQNTMDDMVRTFGMGIIPRGKLDDPAFLKPQHGKWPKEGVSTYGGTLKSTFGGHAEELKKLRDAERAIPELWIKQVTGCTVHASRKLLDNYRKQTAKVIAPVTRFEDCGVRPRENNDNIICRVLMPYEPTARLLTRMKEDGSDGFSSKSLWLGSKKVGNNIFVVRTARREAHSPWVTSDFFLVFDEHDVWGVGTTMLNARKDQDRARLREFKSMLKVA